MTSLKEWRHWRNDVIEGMPNQTQPKWVSLKIKPTKSRFRLSQTQYEFILMVNPPLNMNGSRLGGWSEWNRPNARSPWWPIQCYVLMIEGKWYSIHCSDLVYFPESEKNPLSENITLAMHGKHWFLSKSMWSWLLNIWGGFCTAGMRYKRTERHLGQYQTEGDTIEVVLQPDRVSLEVGWLHPFLGVLPQWPRCFLWDVLQYKRTLGQYRTMGETMEPCLKTRLSFSWSLVGSNCSEYGCPNDPLFSVRRNLKHFMVNMRDNGGLCDNQIEFLFKALQIPYSWHILDQHLPDTDTGLRGFLLH